MIIEGNKMKKLEFFDCNCSIGRTVYPFSGDLSTPDDLLKEMDCAGIDKALVFHTFSRDVNPMLGNDILIEQIKNYKNLFPVWTVLPHQTGEMLPPDKLLKVMENKGIKAVRLYPTKDFQSFSISEWNSGKLLSALENAYIPLMMDIEINGWDVIQGLISKYPKLPVIAMNVSYRHNRFTYPLFEKYSNIYVETSRYFGAGVIEDVYEKFGSGKIIFGTNSPQYTGTSAISMITYAEIPDEAKQAIASDNLKRIITEAYS